MSRRMPIVPTTRPSALRSAAAFRLVGMTSPDAERGGELALLLRADEARERLLEQLVLAEAQQLGDGIVGLQDLALEVGDEHRVGRVFDQALRVPPRLVELAHVAQDADRADHLAVRAAQGGGVQARRNDLAAGAPGIEARVPRDAALHHLV